MFLNLSNHPVSTWSDEQLQAAIDLGYGMPKDMPSIKYVIPMDRPLPHIPPEACTEDVHACAIKLLWELPPETQACHVAGEFVLTYTLVKLLTECSFPCFCATTKREVVETVQPDGSVVKKTVFKFVQWRNYTIP